MTTLQDQLEMFYAGRRISTKNALKDYIKSRLKIRFAMVNNLRRAGKLDSDWYKIEEFDKQTEQQEQILNDHFKGLK
jgi:hypothetical protein